MNKGVLLPQCSIIPSAPLPLVMNNIFPRFNWRFLKKKNPSLYYVGMNVRTYIHTYIHTHIRMGILTYMLVCVRACIDKYVCMYVNIKYCRCRLTAANTSSVIYSYRYTSTCTYIHGYIDTHTYIHTYMRTERYWRLPIDSYGVALVSRIDQMI